MTGEMKIKDYYDETLKEIDNDMTNLQAKWTVNSTNKKYDVNELGHIKYAVKNLIDYIDYGGKKKF